MKSKNTLKREHINKSCDLIRRFLVKYHDDGDNNSLFAQFSEIMNYIDELQRNIETLERFSATLSRIDKQQSAPNKSVFLQNVHHSYAHTDGTYNWPNSREGDMLRQAKKEIEATNTFDCEKD